MKNMILPEKIAWKLKGAMIVIITGLFSFTACAQKKPAPRRDSTLRFPVGYYLAYNSSLIYPGVAAGINYPFIQFATSKRGSYGRIMKIYKERMFSLLVGYYHHPGFHDNLYVVPGYLMRRTKSTGMFMDFWAGVGYSRTFLGGTTYKVDASGNVSKVPLAGFNYCMVAAGGGMGYDFTLKKKRPFSVFGRLDLLAMFPYNSTIYPRPAVEIGVMYRPVHLFLTRTESVPHVKKKRRR